MTSILRSLPACFSRSASVGSRGSVLFPCRPNFRCHFQKRWWSNWCLFCFNTDREKKKQTWINIPIIMCHEPAMKVDILQDATFLSITSKVPEHAFLHQVTDIKYIKKGLILKRKEGGTEKSSFIKKRAAGPSVVTTIQTWKSLLCRGFWLLLRFFAVEKIPRQTPRDPGVDQRGKAGMTERLSKSNRWQRAGRKIDSREAD